MKRTSKFLSGIRRINDKYEKWPFPEHGIKEEPFFLFIITPPRSGSTALAQILNSAQGTALLNKRGEGQWLVPGLCETDRWNPGKDINWESVRSVWYNRLDFIIGLVQNVQLVIEKSPPNLVRIDQIKEVFPNHSLLAFNRDPYANCASTLYRNHDPVNKSETERIQLITQIAESWMQRSAFIFKWITKWNIVNFTYEDFCENPGSSISKLNQNIPILKTVDVNIKIKVKDYQIQGIANQNERQISKLKPGEIEAISNVLTRNPDIPSFFRYNIR